MRGRWLRWLMDTTMASALPMRATSGQRIRGSVSAEEQARWLERFAASGQSVRAFCAEHGLRPTMLTWWRRRCREQAREAGADGALIEVTRPLSAASRSVASRASTSVVMTISGIRVEIPTGSDPAWAAALIRALAR